MSTFSCFLLLSYPSYFFRSLLTGNLSLACCFCSAPYHFEHLSTTHTAYSGYATSSVLRSHPFFIFHISLNLTFHTVTFGCQFVIVLILEYKISSLTIKYVVVKLDNIITQSDWHTYIGKLDNIIITCAVKSPVLKSIIIAPILRTKSEGHDSLKSDSYQL